MPEIKPSFESKLGAIHYRRMGHAIKELVMELADIHHPTVDYILRRWGIQYVGEGIGIEYPATARQILEDALVKERAHIRKVVLGGARKKLGK